MLLIIWINFVLHTGIGNVSQLCIQISVRKYWNSLIAATTLLSNVEKKNSFFVNIDIKSYHVCYTLKSWTSK